MKTIIVILLLCISTSIFSQKIEGKITYLATSKNAIKYIK
jgi:hypothetical protein